MEKTTIIKERKINGRWTPIIRGGRVSVSFKSPKDYNRKEAKKINYDME